MTHFLARLRAQAKFCEFKVACPNEMNSDRQTDYSNDMMAGRMIAGLVNIEHQGRVFAEAATLTTLKQKFTRLISLETMDKSTLNLHNTMHPLASTVRKGQTTNDGSRKPKPLHPHNTPSLGEDVEGLRIPVDRWVEITARRSGRYSIIVDWVDT